MALAQRHTIYIRCGLPELWSALTDGSVTAQYFYEARIESSFEPGAALRFVLVDHDDETRALVAVDGTIIAAEPERSLAYSFRFCDLDGPPSSFRWTLTPRSPELVRVDVDVDSDGLDATHESWTRIVDGLPLILSGLKTWLETGEPLPRPDESD